MTDIQKKADAKHAEAIHTVVAGIAGVIAGGVAVAAAVVMSDKENQKKVHDAVEQGGHKLQEVAGEVKQKLQEKA